MLDEAVKSRGSWRGRSGTPGRLWSASRCRVQSSSLSCRVRSCFLMTSRSLSVEWNHTRHTGLRHRIHAQPINVQARRVLEYRRGASTSDVRD